MTAKFRDSAPRDWRVNLDWYSIFLMIGLSLVGQASAHAQFTDRPLAGDVAKHKIDQLRLDDSVLRAEISNAQVSRQAEITRLEGRILQLEEQLRDLPASSGSMQLAFILGLAPVGLVADDETQGRDAPVETNQAKSEIPSEPDTKTGTTAIIRQPSQVVHEIVVRDFVLSVEIELLDARARALEKSREVKSLERLSSKGLASAAQLEMQIMQRRRAELQVERLEKQLAGLRRVYPNYFE